MAKKRLLEDALPQVKMLTPSEVAAIFGVDPKTVTRWAAAGRLRFIKTPGGHRRFPEDDVLKYLKGSSGEENE